MGVKVRKVCSDTLTVLVSFFLSLSASATPVGCLRINLHVSLHICVVPSRWAMLIKVRTIFRVQGDQSIKGIYNTFLVEKHLQETKETRTALDILHCTHWACPYYCRVRKPYLGIHHGIARSGYSDIRHVTCPDVIMACSLLETRVNLGSPAQGGQLRFRILATCKHQKEGITITLPLFLPLLTPLWCFTVVKGMKSPEGTTIIYILVTPIFNRWLFFMKMLPKSPNPLSESGRRYAVRAVSMDSFLFVRHVRLEGKGPRTGQLVRNYHVQHQA